MQRGTAYTKHVLSNIEAKLTAWQETAPIAAPLIQALRKVAHRHSPMRGGVCSVCTVKSPCGTLRDLGEEIGVHF